jgi:transforming growth factor-beta-induced protein
MKSLTYRPLLVVLVVGLVSVSVAFAAERRKRARWTTETNKDIVDTAVAAGNFKTLASALKAAGLVETLKGKGPFTVFAPTDEAFAKLPEGTLADLLKPENKAKLTAILTYHVVPGKVMAADVVKLSKAKTVQGSEVTIQVHDGKVKVDDANVVKTDIPCTNGVIHVIDAVILPK